MEGNQANCTHWIHVWKFSRVIGFSLICNVSTPSRPQTFTRLDTRPHQAYGPEADIVGFFIGMCTTVSARMEDFGYGIHPHDEGANMLQVELIAWSCRFGTQETRLVCFEAQCGLCCDILNSGKSAIPECVLVVNRFQKTPMTRFGDPDLVTVARVEAPQHESTSPLVWQCTIWTGSRPNVVEWISRSRVFEQLH